jgi:hypothetical protein
MFELLILFVVLGTAALAVKVGAFFLHLLLLPLKLIGGLVAGFALLPILVLLLPVVVLIAVLIGLAVPAILLVGGIASLFGLLGLCYLL